MRIKQPPSNNIQWDYWTKQRSMSLIFINRWETSLQIVCFKKHSQKNIISGPNTIVKMVSNPQQITMQQKLGRDRNSSKQIWEREKNDDGSEPASYRKEARLNWVVNSLLAMCFENFCNAQYPWHKHSDSYKKPKHGHHGKLKIHPWPGLACPPSQQSFQILVAMSARQMLCDVGN
jgi:hypothetical protein